jgi:hypothetical protein
MLGLRWITRVFPWLRHLFTLRPDSGFVFGPWRRGQLGLPRVYWDFDPGLHASNRHFLGLLWVIGPVTAWYGLTDTN